MIKTNLYLSIGTISNIYKLTEFHVSFRITYKFTIYNRFD